MGLKSKIANLAIAALVLTMVWVPASASGTASWNSLSSGTGNDLYAIWGTEDTSVFIVGESGTILRYNGAEWVLMVSGSTRDLRTIWGTDRSDIFAAGNSGTILHYDGSKWSSMSSGTGNSLNGIWGTDSGSIFAVGSNGTIIFYDGSAWSPLASSSAMNLYSIWGIDSSEVFAVGESGTILRYDGTEWSSMESGTNSDLHSIWGSTGSDIFAVGNSGTILHYNGSQWSSMSSGITSDLYSVWGPGTGDVFVAGRSGTIAHHDGARWSSMSRDTLNDLCAVWGFSSDYVFAAGFAGTILKYIPPIIKSISPAQGEQGQTLKININGTNLADVVEVRLGAGIAVNSFSVQSPDQVEASITIVAGAVPGAREVTVITPGGSFALPDSFIVRSGLPTITGISPAQDRQGATLNLTITGTNLAGTIGIWLGPGIAVNSFTVLSANQVVSNITIALDAEEGVRDLSITTLAGSFTSPKSFTVKPALPVATAITPNQGNRESSLSILIEGMNLSGTTEVQLGTGIRVNRVTVLSANQVSAEISIAAEAATGTRDVTITTPGGTFTLSNSFSVKPALPSITLISPNSGNQSATLKVTIIGKNLDGAGEISFGAGIFVNSLTVLSGSQAEANIIITAAAATGYREVSVTTPGGSFNLPNSFTVLQSLPSITSVSPDYGSQGETLVVLISGSSLDGTTFISLGTGVAVQSFTNLSPTQLNVNIVIEEAAVVGARDVTVITPGGSSTLSQSFNVKEKSSATLFLVLLWVFIVIAIGLFIFILNLLRKRRGARL